MSKKSTSRSRNDGDVDCGSRNGPSSSSEESKCSLCSNLSLKEEGATGPSGDYSSTHKILTPNLEESHRNHEMQPENTHRSQSSLDDDLYGTSDAYNKNLEYLRNKLQSFNLADVENDSYRRFDSSPSDSDSKFNWRDGYLAAGETSFNLSSQEQHSARCEPFRNYSPNSMELDKPLIDTIYESEFDETDVSFKIPMKKTRFREKTPRYPKIVLQSSPESLNLSSSASPNYSASSLSFRSSFGLSPGSAGLPSTRNVNVPDNIRISTLPDDGINYVVPVKRVCTRKEIIPKSKRCSSKVKEKRKYFKAHPRFNDDYQSSLSKSFNKQPERCKMFIVNVEKTYRFSEEPNQTLDTVQAERSDTGEVDFKQTRRSVSMSVRLQPLVKSAGAPQPSSSKSVNKQPHKHFYADSEGRYTRSATLRLKPASKAESTLSTPNSNKFSKNINELIYLNLQNLSEPEDNSTRTTNASWNATQRTKSVSTAHSKNFELSLNLPSSIIGESTSNTPTPLEPNIVIINTSTVKRTLSKSRRSNKIVPCSTESLCSSGDHRKSSEPSPLTKLYDKYYGETSDFSSNVNSTPPCKISTSASARSSFPTISSEQNISKKTPPSNSNQSSPFNSDVDYEPRFTCSLDFPKRSMHSYIFPAITRIATISGRFFLEKSLLERCFDDEPEKKNKNCYRNIAESLLNSPTLSPVAKEKICGHGDSCSLQILSDSPNNLNNVGNRKQAQSTDISFYSVPSSMTLDKEYSNENFRGSDSSSVTNEEVDASFTGCCCCNIFFPRRRARFFP